MNGFCISDGKSLSISYCIVAYDNFPVLVLSDFIYVKTNLGPSSLSLWFLSLTSTSSS